MKNIIITLLFAFLFQASCSKKESFNKKDYTLLLSSASENKSASIINKNLIIDDKKTTDIVFANKAKISSNIISNIVFFGDYFYFIDSSLRFYKYSNDDLHKEASTKIKLKSVDKAKFNKVFLTVDKEFIYILTDFGKLVCLNKSDLSVEYETAFNNSFNAPPVSESFYLYLKASDNQIYSVFSNNGKQIWNYKQEPAQTSYNKVSSVLLSPNYLIFAVSQFKMIILNKTNGDLITSLNSNQNDGDNFKINGIKKSDLFFKSTNAIVSINDNIDNENIDDYKDQASHFYTIGDDKFSSFNAKSMNSIYSQHIGKINDIYSFAEGFVAKNSFNELYFINPFSKHTVLLQKFATQNNANISLATLKSTMDDTHFAFVATDDNIYVLRKNATSENDDFIIEKSKTFMQKPNKKHNVNNDSIKFKDINFITTHNNNLFVFNSGRVYRSTNF